MLEASPDGLSDTALAQALGGGVRSQTVNQLCRRLVTEGLIERVGTRPILNRLSAPPTRRRRRTATPAVEAVPVPSDAPRSPTRRKGARTAAPSASETDASPATDPAAAATGRTANGTRPKRGRTAVDASSPTPDASETEASPAPTPTPDESSGPQGTSPSPMTTTRRTQSRTDVAAPPVDPPDVDPPDVDPPAVDPGADPEAPPLEAEVVTPDEPSPTCGPPPYDALQAWSRVVNVQALVAHWLVGRGATLRSATLDGQGPTRDLVASLDGDDVHVEVTGWPPDGARTHPTTIAGDWFSGAEQAAAQRRRAHPRARIVIALPDTRRYRSLTEQRATSLAGAKAEVWFVDPAGTVHAR